MPRVDLSSVCIEEIVLDKKGVPGIDEVHGSVVSDLKIPIQSKEPLEGTIDGVVESDRIETIVTGTSKEKLAVVGGDVDRLS